MHICCYYQILLKYKVARLYDDFLMLTQVTRQGKMIHWANIPEGIATQETTFWTVTHNINLIVANIFFALHASHEYG